ncbi:acyltransferase family protein [Beutenbergia cavernae]|uniref:acyltransferase family protein n=1 Tax=Beutenbergia cavernae TaxID=84757 RepID=UPI0002D7FC5D|nr:acyltransferase [Beutenbergia cavernae]
MHHVLLTIPALALAYLGLDGAVSPEAGTAAWWLFRTPARVVWAGPEAVFVFFALSGFVLTILAERRSGAGRWVGAYAAQRFVRLYVPVWGAVVLAVLLALVVPRVVTSGNPWLAAHEGAGPGAVVRDFTLVVETSSLNTALWSLRWEVWFSALLPVAWWALRRLPVRGHALAWVSAMIALSAAGRLDAVTSVLPASALSGGFLVFLPIFGIGMVLARDRVAVARLGDRLATTRIRWAWPVVVALAILALVSPTYLGARVPGSVADAATHAASLVGVTVLLVAALEWRAFAALLERPALQWLGVRSFSLYLVHEPIVVAAALALGIGAWGHLPVMAATVVVAVIVAALFYRFLEAPSIRLSHQARRLVEGAGKRGRRVDEANLPAVR